MELRQCTRAEVLVHKTSLNEAQRPRICHSHHQQGETPVRIRMWSVSVCLMEALTLTIMTLTIIISTPAVSTEVVKMRIKLYLLWTYVQLTASTDYTTEFSWNSSCDVFWAFLLFLPSTFALGPDGKLMGFVPQIYEPRMISSHEISLLFCTNVSPKSRHYNFCELPPFYLFC